MSVPIVAVNDVDDPRAVFTADGVQTVFTPTQPKILVRAIGDLVVLIDGLSPSISYTISGVNDSDGIAVTFDSAPSAGAKVLIYRDMPLERTTVYGQQKAWSAQSVNAEFADHVMMIQQARGAMERAVRVPITDTQQAELPAADQRAGKFLAFNSAGAPIALDITGDTLELNTDSDFYATRADVEMATVPSGKSFLVIAGYSDPRGGGGGVYANVSSEPAHAGKVQSSDGAWFELVSGRPNPLQFGAKGDDSTDDTSAINDCIAFVKAQGNKGYRVIDGLGQKYRVTDEILLDFGGFEFANFWLTADASANWSASNAVLTISGGFNARIDNVLVDGNDEANNGVKNTSEAFISVVNTRAWRCTDNAFDMQASAYLERCSASRWNSNDTEAQDVSKRTGNAFKLSGTATDFRMHACNGFWCDAPLFVDTNVHHVRCTECHFFNGSSDSAHTDSALVRCYGYKLNLLGCYLDLGAIHYYVRNNRGVDLSIVASQCLADKTKATYDAWIIVDTDQADTNFNNFLVPAQAWTYSPPSPGQTFKFTTTGSGSWTPDVDALENLNGAYLSGIAGAHRFFSDATGDPIVASFNSSENTNNRALLRCKAPGTTAPNGAEFGVEDDDAIARAHGIVGLRVTRPPVNQDGNELVVEIPQLFAPEITGASPLTQPDRFALAIIPNGAGNRHLAVYNPNTGTWFYADGTAA